MRTAWLFVLIALDGVIPLVPGEGALLSQTPAAVASGPAALCALVLLAASAALLGDVTTFALGRRVGATRFAWQRRPRVAEVIDRVSATLDQRGAAVIVSARFVAGWRVAVSFAAGATRLPWPRFLAASGLGVSLWAMYMVGLGSTVAALTGASTLVVAVLSLALMTLLTQGLRWSRTRRRRRGPTSGVLLEPPATTPLACGAHLIAHGGSPVAAARSHTAPGRPGACSARAGRR